MKFFDLFEQMRGFRNQVNSYVGVPLLQVMSVPLCVWIIFDMDVPSTWWVLLVPPAMTVTLIGVQLLTMTPRDPADFRLVWLWPLQIAMYVFSAIALLINVLFVART